MSDPKDHPPISPDSIEGEPVYNEKNFTLQVTLKDLGVIRYHVPVSVGKLFVKKPGHNWLLHIARNYKWERVTEAQAA